MPAPGERPVDNEPTVLRVPSPPRRGTSVVVTLGAILVVLAVLKPWTLAGTSGGPGLERPTAGAAAGSPSTSGQPGPTARATTAIPDPNAMACMSSEGSRVLALVRAPGLEVRTWLTLDDVSATDPLAPAVVPLRLLSSNVIGIGICARRLVQDDGVSSAAEILEVARMTVGSPLTGAGSPSLTDLGVPQVVTLPGSDPTLGVLYGPPTVPLPPHGRLGPSAIPVPSATPVAWPTWPVGDYAIAFRFPGDSPATVRWLRLEILPAVGLYG